VAAPGPAAPLGRIAQCARLWRTVRWLKPVQIVGRVRFKLLRPRPNLRPPPALRPAATHATEGTATWIRPAAREPSLLAPTRMRFLGVEHDLGDVGWDDPQLPLLWRYNQHYFDDLNAAGAAARSDWHRALVARWLADNPPARGTAWAPYPTSLRIVNWVKWFRSAAAHGGEPVPAAWIASLATQARWLERRLEWHLLGNHLFVNAKALVFAGLFFAGAEAERWLASGLEILARELPEQVLADGGQFERSPMYQVLALEDVLDLVNLIAAAGAAAGTAPGSAAAAWLALLQGHASRMLHWQRCLRHPGGAMARFNDCAEGIAPPAHEIERYAAALAVVAPPPVAEGVLALRESGYVRAARGPAVALFDVAPIGPDYLPGHAHADTLSFELSVFGRELIVNRGTSVYGDGPRRLVERGTAAHSTVQVGAHDSSEVWAGFRVGRRARVRDLAIDGWTIEAAHDGYAHLPGRPLHRRRWELGPYALTVCDQIEATVPAARSEPCVARFHLAAGLQCEPVAPGAWAVLFEGAKLAEIQVTKGRATFEDWQHARRFGELAPALALAVTLEGGVAEVRLAWPD
jgi:uncharacterized heparinase superfamily protein